jgi:hypothetical protein
MTLKGTEYKIFDPRDGSTGTTGDELLDASVVKRGDTWEMYLAGQAHGQGATNLFSATLPQNAPLSVRGWSLARDNSGELQPLAGRERSKAWDEAGGRHCPAYVKGWNAEKETWVERIYYAGGAEFMHGPYKIGYLEWDGEKWTDQPAPCFEATEKWENGSVYEPNIIWHQGKWKLWYVAGANKDNILVHGYAESDDGIHWGSHTMFAPPEMKMFDFCVRPRAEGFDAIFSRLHIGDETPAPETGLWWCCAKEPSGNLKDWSAPVQIMTAEDKGWHKGPFKPSLQFAEDGRAMIFFDGMYNTGEPSPFPFALTLGCLVIELPNGKTCAS